MRSSLIVPPAITASTIALAAVLFAAPAIRPGQALRPVPRAKKANEGG